MLPKIHIYNPFLLPPQIMNKNNKTLSDVSIYNLMTRLTVRFLVAGTSAGTSKLLGLASSGVSDQQSSVIADQDILNLFLGGLINI